MIIELITNEPDGYGGNACAFIDSRFVIAIEPMNYTDGRVQRYGSRVYLSSGAQITTTLTPGYVAKKVWSDLLPPGGR